MILETGSLVAVNMLRERQINRSSCTSFLGQIKKLQMSEHATHHVGRKGNIVAHELARMGRIEQRRLVAWGANNIGNLCQADYNDPP